MTRSAHGTRYRTLIAALVVAREEGGLTQGEVARRLRRPQSYVSKYERGERRLDVIEFIEVAEALKADATSIFKRLLR